MTDLQGVIRLLYRADWTRLSLYADVRSESDEDLVASRVLARMREKIDPWVSASSTWTEPTGEEPRGYQSWPATLLIAPGGRYRQEYPDEPSGHVTGSNGERDWVWRPEDPGPPELPSHVVHGPPRPHLFCPSELLGEYTLEVQGPVVASGRDAIAVVATKRTDIGHTSHLGASSLGDDLSVIVDAELGILLRYEETFEGQRVSLTELTTVVLDPPEAADLSRFEPPAGSRTGQDSGESLWVSFSGPGWEAMKTVAGLAAGALGASIRFAPHRPGRENFSEGELQPAMPPAEPAVLKTDGDPSLPDDLVYLLYRSGENPAFTATVTEWHDWSAMTARVPDSVRSAGLGGLGYLIDSITGATHGNPVARTSTRLRVSGRDKYRIDYLSRSGKNHAKTIASDGEQRWQAFEAHTVVGPAHPPPREFANLVDSSWLFSCRLSGGNEISYRGRRAYQLSVAQGGNGRLAAPLLFFPADVIVDAELGCLLRLISFAADRPASWYELSDIGAEPIPADEFRPDVPPGVRVIDETGNAFADAAAVMPGAAGRAIRTATDVARRTNDALSAARSFLDDLRGRSRR